MGRSMDKRKAAIMTAHSPDVDEPARKRRRSVSLSSRPVVAMDPCEARAPYEAERRGGGEGRGWWR